MTRPAVAPLFSTLCAAAAMVLLFGSAAPVSSQQKSAYKAPRTPWGDPDLQGIWPGTDMINTPMNRPKEYGTRLFLTEDEFQQRANQLRAKQAKAATATPTEGNVSINPPGYWLDLPKGSRQTSLIIEPADGQMPPYTEEALARRVKRQQDKAGHGPNESYTDQSYYDRCISRGVLGSILPVIYNNGNQIVQAPGYVVILQEMIHEARVIPLGNRPHVGKGVRSYMGDSRGHWEGDTLVVETTNFVGDTNGFGGNGGGEPHSADMVLTERFTRVAPDEVYYEAHVNDPKTWQKPFTIGFPLKADPQYKLFEYACHEGNYAMIDMLTGARAEEKASGK